MTKQKVWILHPGQMGISVAASIQNSGHTVYWASEGRSRATHERAAKFGLSDTGTLAALCETCTVIVSVCPPHVAEEIAEQVLGRAFRGLYLDANAISPQRAMRIEQVMQNAGVTFVDGGIIGASVGKASALKMCYAAYTKG